MKVLFVCTGNTCRSPMAEACVRHALQMRGIPAEDVGSAGICAQNGAGASAEAAAVMQMCGISMKTFRSRMLTPEMMRCADWIVCMSARHKAMALQLAPDCAAKTVLLLRDQDVPDPYGGDTETYRQVLTMMQPALDRWTEMIAKQWEQPKNIQEKQ